MADDVSVETAGKEEEEVSGSGSVAIAVAVAEEDEMAARGSGNLSEWDLGERCPASDAGGRT